MLTIAKAHDNISSASATETVDFDSIVAQYDTNDDNKDITDIDTQELGLLGAEVLGLDEIEIPAEASVEEAVETYTENDDENEYADLAIANVTNYVNVRSNPDTDSEIVGKIYNGAVAQVLSTAGDNDDWFQVVSGNVEGYIKAEFFIYGDDAAAVIDNYVTRYAVVIADRLNVREEPSTDAKRIGYIDKGEKVKLIENQGDWLKVEYTSDKIGYVATEYVNITEEFVYAKTISEEQAEIAASKVLEERENVSEETVSENVTITVTPPSTNYSSNSELRNSIVEYSMQFLGNKYVHGGQSLVTGTDCSGFTSLIYKEFGYSISRTLAGQLSSNGRSISYSEIQPGDIICYGSSGKCTHVALYIGNGQIIHSANSKKGVIISSATYDTILGVKNIID
jgi:cell wall-associated NlpC family hydrolase